MRLGIAPRPPCGTAGCRNRADVRLLVEPTCRCLDCVGADARLPSRERYERALRSAQRRREA